MVYKVLDYFFIWYNVSKYTVTKELWQILLWEPLQWKELNVGGSYSTKVQDIVILNC